MRDGSRNTNIPSSGFSAGPCLLKDTMQLSSFYNHKLPLGFSAMQVNQGLPKFILKELEKNTLEEKNYWPIRFSFQSRD